MCESGVHIFLPRKSFGKSAAAAAGRPGRVNCASAPRVHSYRTSIYFQIAK